MRLTMKFIKNFGKAVAIVGLLILPGCSTAPIKPESMPRGDYEYTKQYLSWKIQKEMKKHDVKGLSIALVDDQKVIWAEGFGFADVENKVSAIPETVYRVGSISKLFTVTAAMQLAEQGQIDIDRPLKTYLPQFSMKSRFSDAGVITPRSIMTHHSGIPANRTKGMWAYDAAPFTQLVKNIREEHVAYPPNLIFSYSNLAMTLLGHMVEEVSGRDFVSYMDDNLLQPMGMKQASFVLRPEIEGLLAKSYSEDKAIAPPPLRDLPAGALYANVLDLSRFVQMVFADGRSNERQILKPETLNEMIRPQNTDVVLDVDFRIGLGWFLVDYGIQNAGPVVSHGGGLPCFLSQLAILPKHKLGVVVLTNSCTGGHMAHDVAMTALKQALEAKTGMTQPEPNQVPRTPKPQVVNLPVESLKTYEGRYTTNVGPASISSKNGALRAEAMGKTLHLVPQADGRFGVKYKLFGLIPIKNILGTNLDDVSLSFTPIAGREVVVLHNKNEKHLLGEKVKIEPIPKVWIKRIGAYQINNPDDAIQFKEITLKDEEGVLTLNYRSKMIGFQEHEVSLELTPVSDTEALIMGLGTGKGESIYVIQADGKERLLHSGYEARRISKE
ncbi:Beta-lactamase class C-like and penicillin binding proteins (PBPs) superfamily [hydrothermal vent metagenome]|uniref:Beta-lactamase class C-like and penicillin binding proteins (PBPs) superfamily n=1 Tax=hydrothermal vent metagenome TaxID=652676 RepID=A0A3B1DPC5_9ZZZZ